MQPYFYEQFQFHPTFLRRRDVDMTSNYASLFGSTNPQVPFQFGHNAGYGVGPTANGSSIDVPAMYIPHSFLSHPPASQPRHLDFQESYFTSPFLGNPYPTASSLPGLQASPVLGGVSPISAPALTFCYAEPSPTSHAMECTPTTSLFSPAAFSHLDESQLSSSLSSVIWDQGAQEAISDSEFVQCWSEFVQSCRQVHINLPKSPQRQPIPYALNPRESDIMKKYPRRDGSIQCRVVPDGFGVELDLSDLPNVTPRHLNREAFEEEFVRCSSSCEEIGEHYRLWEQPGEPPCHVNCSTRKWYIWFPGKTYCGVFWSGVDPDNEPTDWRQIFPLIGDWDVWNRFLQAFPLGHSCCKPGSLVKKWWIYRDGWIYQKAHHDKGEDHGDDEGGDEDEDQDDGDGAKKKPPRGQKEPVRLQVIENHYCKCLKAVALYPEFVLLCIFASCFKQSQRNNPATCKMNQMNNPYPTT
ncbi:hypothetical protein BT69DRAFT_595137 [Atractiella rhizophila]|nr:hypothetical protein BT69DRAFT_595137 [Atractiella rhizophila]